MCGVSLELSQFYGYSQLGEQIFVARYGRAPFLYP